MAQAKVPQPIPLTYPPPYQGTLRPLPLPLPSPPPGPLQYTHHPTHYPCPTLQHKLPPCNPHPPHNFTSTFPTLVHNPIAPIHYHHTNPDVVTPSLTSSPTPPSRPVILKFINESKIV